jgi:hypothetical protein
MKLRKAWLKGDWEFGEFLINKDAEEVTSKMLQEVELRNVRSSTKLCLFMNTKLFRAEVDKIKQNWMK